MQQRAGGSGLYLIAGALFLVGLGYLIFSGISGGSVYFLNVSEALALEPGHEAGKLTQARLFGTVAGQDLQAKTGVLGVVFRLVDKDDPAKTMMVDYSGAVPDTFKPGVEVIVEGSYNPAAHTFSASTLMTKCPSKYQKENRDKALKG